MARQRGSNFLTFEKMLLKDLMEEFGFIIQDKRTDSMTLSGGVVTGRVERIPGGLCELTIAYISSLLRRPASQSYALLSLSLSPTYKHTQALTNCSNQVDISRGGVNEWPLPKWHDRGGP